MEFWSILKHFKAKKKKDFLKTVFPPDWIVFSLRNEWIELVGRSFYFERD